MWKVFVVLAGLVGSTSFAADQGGDPAGGWFDATLQSNPLRGKKPGEIINPEKSAEQTEEEKRREERLRELASAQGTKNARVVVLEWANTTTNYSNETLQRNIRTRIARPSAKFLPEVDMYQAGRKEPNDSVAPLDQRASPPDSAIDVLNALAEETEPIPFNALTTESWGVRAVEMREKLNEIWFLDRPALREPLFRLYIQIGYAADNRSDPSPPFYDFIGRKTVNYYWYLAGALAYEDPQMMSKVSNKDWNDDVTRFKDMLDSGEIERIPLSFELSGQWDAQKFASEYELFINGREYGVIKDPKGLVPVPPGPTDVYLRRSDGHSLSDRVDLGKLNDKIYFVRDVARKRMGIDFIDQLMEHPNECKALVDGDILIYLAIYQKLHPGAEIYVAIPVAGSPNRIELWRWMAEIAELQKVQDNTGGFPVRFALLMGTGMNFGGVSVPTVEDLEGEPPPAIDPTDPVLPQLAPPSLSPIPDSIPFQYLLRGHYGRLMVQLGAQWSIGLKGRFEEVYQTKMGKRFRDEGDEFFSGSADPFESADGKWLFGNRTPTVTQTTQFSDGSGAVQTGAVRPSTRELLFQRLISLGVGAMLGPDAAYGIGPRGYLRTGFYNAPHAIDATGHIGYTGQLPSKKESGSGRVIGIIDADIFAGAVIPYGDSITTVPYIQYERSSPSAPTVDSGPWGDGVWQEPKRIGTVTPTFGLAATIGLTF